MKLSARNQLQDTVKGVKLGAIMAEVLVEVGRSTVAAEISQGSAKRLKLTTGAEVTVIITSTEVMIGK